MFKAAVAVVLSFTILAGPCFADVIGSKPRREADAESKTVVAKRLGGLGVHWEDTRHQVNSLTARNLAFFAQHPGSIRMAGAQESGQGSEFMTGSASPLWYEILGGSLLIIGTAVWILVLTHR